jgi:hypothetical protein
LKIISDFSIINFANALMSCRKTLIAVNFFSQSRYRPFPSTMASGGGKNACHHPAVRRCRKRFVCLKS